MDDDDCECEEGAPAWMATFSDMATLLLTFFVLLLSFANMDIENFKMALGSVKEAFGVNKEVKGDFAAMSNELIELSETPMSSINAEEQDSYEEVKALRNYIKSRNMQHRVDVHGSDSSIILRVKDVALFDSGSDQFTPSSQPVLDLVEDLFHKSNAVLSIEGHTDNVPISRARFPSNWELSAGRSAAVLRRYVKIGLDRRRLAIAGYGELRPIADNKTKEGRSKNRRVEFVFKRSGKKKGRLFNLGMGAGVDNKAKAPVPTGTSVKLLDERDKAKEVGKAAKSDQAEADKPKDKNDSTSRGTPSKDDKSRDGESKDQAEDSAWKDGVKDKSSKNPFDKK